MRFFAAKSLAVNLLLTAPSACVGADDGAVLLGRLEKAGLQRSMLMETEYSLKTIYTSGGEEVRSQDDSWKATIEMTYTTDKVDERGEATGLTLVIKNFTLVENGQTSQPLKQGTLVKGSLVNGKKHFATEGQPLEKDAQKVLERMIDLANEGKGNEQIAFGLDKPRKPGEEWEVDAKELIATMPEDMPFLIKENAVTGKMKFVEITVEGNRKVATVQGEVEMPIVGMRDMPAGFNAEGSSMRVALYGQMPLDPTTLAIREGMTMILDFQGGIAGPDGERQNIKISGRQISKAREVP